VAAQGPFSSRENMGGRLFANIGAAWSALRRPPRTPPRLASVHGMPWWAWTLGALLAIVFAAAVFDAGSVAWAAALPDWMHSAFRRFTVAGKSDWYLIPSGVGLLVLALGAWRRIDRRLKAAWAEIAALLAFTFFSVGLAAIAVNIVKQLVGRGRPILFAEDGGFTFDAFNFDYANASFPSGHATTAGAAIIVGALLFPRLRIPIVIVGLLIPASRIVIGAHYPSDTVAGLVLGMGVAYSIARFLLRRGLGFRVDAAGRMRPKTTASAASMRRAPAAFFAAPFRALGGRTG
jgi:membrane-associated phospholipid phosphatase